MKCHVTDAMYIICHLKGICENSAKTVFLTESPIHKISVSSFHPWHR